MKADDTHADLFIELCMCDEGSSLRLEEGDEVRAADLRSKGLIIGKRWVKLTDKGRALRDRISA